MNTVNVTFNMNNNTEYNYVNCTIAEYDYGTADYGTAEHKGELRK